MSTNKHFSKICIVAIILALVLTAVFMNGKNLGIKSMGNTSKYENRLFDTSKVHKIDIVMDNWDSFIKSCQNKEYSSCSVVIDGESYKNVGICAKGDTSLTSVSEMNSNRYSFKIKFDKYKNVKNYHGLNKLSLNNMIFDNTYMKDYLTYRLMEKFGVSSPLCSYVSITVNGKDWGLYLALEGVDERFLKRNYGSNYGTLYKPGETDDVELPEEQNNKENLEASQENDFYSGTIPNDSVMWNMWDEEESDIDETKLKYIDDNPENYTGIFKSAKTKVKASDKRRLIQSLKNLSGNQKIESVVNVDKMLRYFVVHNFVVNGDSYTGSEPHNYYLYEKDGALSILPWDYNLAFGAYHEPTATNAVNDPIDTPLSIPKISERPMLAWIFSNQEYTKMYHQYYRDFLESVDIISIIEETEKMIAPYVKKDPTKFCTYERFEVGANTLKTFCKLRSESIKAQIDGIIPSTLEGRSDGQARLIDASGISIPDMGALVASN